jgi:hypothetical protein
MIVRAVEARGPAMAAAGAAETVASGVTKTACKGKPAVVAVAGREAWGRHQDYSSPGAAAAAV